MSLCPLTKTSKALEMFHSARARPVWLGETFTCSRYQTISGLERSGKTVWNEEFELKRAQPESLNSARA